MLIAFNCGRGNHKIVLARSENDPLPEPDVSEAFCRANVTFDIHILKRGARF